MNSKIVPNEIKTLRESLGLSREEAGKVFGGGRTAFHEYESGRRIPGIATTKLLEFARRDPTGFTSLFLREESNNDRDSTMTQRSPFQVQADQLERFDPHDQIKLITNLLTAEANQNGIPLSGIHVCANPNIPDAGEDASISWPNEPARTDFLPSNNCVIQLKAKAVGPSEIAKDLVNKDGELKERVRDVLRQGGTYIVLCTKTYSNALIKGREASMYEMLREKGLEVNHDQIEFRDAMQIAVWINHHPTVALSVLEKISPASTKHCTSWSWAIDEHEQLSGSYLDDPRLQDLENKIDVLKKEERVVRIEGCAGIGRTRMVLECFSPKRRLSDMRQQVIYLDTQDISDAEVMAVAKEMFPSNTNGVFIVDGGSVEVNRRLEDLANLQQNNMKLIVIESMMDLENHPGSIRMEAANRELTEAQVNAWCPGINYSDRKSLVDLTCGFPKFTRMICNSWAQYGSISDANETYLLDRYLTGNPNHSPHESADIHTTRILAALGGIRKLEEKKFEPILKIMTTEISIQQFQTSVKNLRRRSVVKDYGPSITIEPKVLALKLAEWQWSRWSPEQWEKVLLEHDDHDLKESMCRQLSLLNDKSISRSVVDHLFRAGGLFRSEIRSSNGAKYGTLLPSLAEIHATPVVKVLGEIVDQLCDKQTNNYFGDYISSTLYRSAFASENYESSTQILIKVAAFSLTSGPQASLDELHSLLGTAANSKMRLRLLQSYVENKNQNIRKVVQELLSFIVQDALASRFVGSEKHGVRKANEPWTPKTWDELNQYKHQAAKLLSEFAKVDDEAGRAATEELGKSIIALVDSGSIDLVESLISDIGDRMQGCWPEALKSIRFLLDFFADEHTPDIIARIDKLRRKLEPTSPKQKFQRFLDGVYFNEAECRNLDLPDAEKKREVQASDLVQEVLVIESLLDRNISRLCEGTIPHVRRFAKALAISTEEPAKWWARVVAETCALGAEKVSFEFVLGYVEGLKERRFEGLENFKREFARITFLIPAIPRFCLITGVASEDIQLVVDLLDSGKLAPKHLDSWAMQGVFESVPSDDIYLLIDRLLESESEGFAVVVRMTTCNFSALQKFPKRQTLLVFQLAELVAQQPKILNEQCVFLFTHLMKSVLDGQSIDSQKRRLASVLAQNIIRLLIGGRSREIRDLAEYIFMNFPEQALATLKSSIGDDQCASMLTYKLSDLMPSQQANPLITLIPVKLLIDWCYEDETEASQFLATTIPFLKKIHGSHESEYELHPYMTRLIDEFGHLDSLWDGIDSNLSRFIWMGEQAPYVERYLAHVQNLREHDRIEVRNAAHSLRQRVCEDLKRAKDQDGLRAGLRQF